MTRKNAATYSEPFVDALCVKFMRAWKYPEQLARLEIAHTYNAGSLIALMGVGVKFVTEQLFYLQFGQASRFRLS